MSVMPQITKTVTDDDRALYHAIGSDSSEQQHVRFHFGQRHAEQLANERRKDAKTIRAGLENYLYITAIDIMIRPAASLEDLKKRASLVAHYQQRADNPLMANVRDMLTIAIHNDMVAFGIDPQQPFEF